MSGRVVNILADLADDDWRDYREVLPRALAEQGIQARIARDMEPDEVDYIIYTPAGRIRDFSPYVRTRAVLSLWAGVERIVANPTLTQPLTRMVDPGLREGMREWVTGQVLRHHLGLDRHICRRTPGWAPQVPPLARDRGVGILGLGALGQAAGQALAGLGFRVLGWSRRAKEIPGIAAHAGPEGLETVLAAAEILVLLLPLTPATENILNAERIARLPRGAVVINPGRGALIDDAALLEALDSGQLSHATLDVFRTEPLPDDHPFWTHPGVTVSPHVASATRPALAARVIAENIRRAEAGAPLLHLVDRAQGY